MNHQSVHRTGVLQLPRKMKRIVLFLVVYLDFDSSLEMIAIHFRSYHSIWSHSVTQQALCVWNITVKMPIKHFNFRLWLHSGSFSDESDFHDFSFIIFNVIKQKISCIIFGVRFHLVFSKCASRPIQNEIDALRVEESTMDRIQKFNIIVMIIPQMDGHIAWF